MKYEILDDDGNVINTIISDQAFVEQYYPGHYRELPEPPPDYSAQNKAEAMSLLQATDWVELGDVADPANPPYLSNKADFTAYRAALRSIAVNPPTTPAVFPAKPDEVWSQ